MTFGPEDPPLTAWMAAYQAGSADAFDRLHEALAPDLRAYLISLCRDQSRADDLLQETFLQVHRHRSAHIPGSPVRPWVFAIAKRVFLMDRRGAGRRERYEQLSAAHSPARTGNEADRVHARQQVESAVRQLPAGGRAAFLLHHVLGLSFKEIGQRLGIRPGAAKLRSSRAVNTMRAILRGGRDE